MVPADLPAPVTNGNSIRNKVISEPQIKEQSRSNLKWGKANWTIDTVTHLFAYLSNISTNLVMYQDPILRLRYETKPGIVAYPNKKSASLGMVSGGMSSAASASMFRIPVQNCNILHLYCNVMIKCVKNYCLSNEIRSD